MGTGRVFLFMRGLGSAHLLQVRLHGRRLTLLLGEALIDGGHLAVDIRETFLRARQQRLLILDAPL